MFVIFFIHLDEWKREQENKYIVYFVFFLIFNLLIHLFLFTNIFLFNLIKVQTEKIYNPKTNYRKRNFE